MSLELRTPPRAWNDENPCDVCLINPPWITKEDNIWHGIKSAMPPLALLSIAAYLEQRGLAVSIVDIHVEKLSTAELREKLLKLAPKIVGITVMTATAVPSNLVARVVKRALPHALVVMGGVHAEALPEECLSNASVDVVVRGDGEMTFASLCQAHLLGVSWKGVDGISFRDDLSGPCVARHNRPGKVIMDLNQLPFPAYHLVPMHLYYPAIGAYRKLPAINMLMTRGCPGQCTFCNSAMTSLRSHDAELVVDEIMRLKREFGIREIQFYDDTFTIFRPNVMKFCRLMVERNVDVSWCAFARVDCLNDEMVRAMKRAGCHQMLFGLESGDPAVLERIGKPIQLGRTIEAVRMVRASGIQVRGAFVFGCEEETPETLRTTLNFALSLNLDLAIFNIATPYPGTRLFRWAREQGYLEHEDWTEYELGRPLINQPTLSGRDVLEFYRKSYRAFYWRPGSIARRIAASRSINHWTDMARAFSFIMLRHKLGVRGGVRADWTQHKKEDFFDFPLCSGATATRLTYQLREEQVEAAVSR